MTQPEILVIVNRRLFERAALQRPVDGSISDAEAVLAAGELLELA